MSRKYPFDRPVIILAAPRSGSTLLFETLANSTDLWTIGGESHGIFEAIDRFNPLAGHCDSNELGADDATPQIIKQIQLWFYQHLRDSLGRPLQSVRNADTPTPRLLEKTPKNALRTSLLNEIFPDALFIYLYRNPRENISAIMEAWRSGRFVTYPSLPGRHKPWSLLLPRGWQGYHNASLAETAAFQWQQANSSIVRELSKLDNQRWISVSYQQQVKDPTATIKRICAFCDISAESILDAISSNQQRLSQYTLTAPSANKWHKNLDALRTVIPTLQDTVGYLKDNTEGIPDHEFDITLPAEVLNQPAAQTSGPVTRNLGRNKPCYCGSGKKYKHCHGKPGQEQGAQQ